MNAIRIIRVTIFRLVCLLQSYCSVCTFVFDPRVGRYEKSKMVWFLLINIIHGLLNTTEIQYNLFPTLIYPENIWVLKKRYLTEITLNFYSTTYIYTTLTRIINPQSSFRGFRKTNNFVHS